MTTLGVSPDLTRVLKVNSTLREHSTSLRAYSRCARADAQATRVQAERLRLLLRGRRDGLDAGRDTIEAAAVHTDLPGRFESLDSVDAEEIIDLLVTQHDFQRIDASLDVALEMEREELPARCHLLTATQALDVMHRILQRH